jgi:hypothetical protein
MTKLYKKMAVAVFKPEMVGNKINSFTIDLMNSDIDRDTCKAIGGEYVDDVLGGTCYVHLPDVIDASIQDMVWGRFFTKTTAPTTIETITGLAKAEQKEKPYFQFDCGQGTSDIYALVTEFENPENKNYKWYKKAVDLRCFKPPEPPSPAEIFASSSRGSIHSTFPKEEE